VSGSYRVDLAELLDTVDRMASFERSLAEAWDDVDARVNRLHATWSGSAAAAHRAAHDQWRAGAAQMHAALVVMRRIATTAHDNYAAAVSANLRMWGC
jgi:WXG100 family type VII secretion target